MSFFGRVFQYLVNEVAVKSLAESRAFQQFAMRTHQHVEKVQHAAKNMPDVVNGSLRQMHSHVSEFGQALKEEVKKDFGKKK